MARMYQRQPYTRVTIDYNQVKVQDRDLGWAFTLGKELVFYTAEPSLILFDGQRFRSAKDLLCAIEAALSRSEQNYAA